GPISRSPAAARRGRPPEDNHVDDVWSHRPYCITGLLKNWLIIVETRTIFRDMTEPTRIVGHRDGVPIYQYRSDPDTSPVSVLRRDGQGERGRHIHDFPAVWYVPAAGLVYVAAAGQVLDPAQLGHPDGGVAVFFDPAALGEDARSPWPTWRVHPLLFPF